MFRFSFILALAALLSSPAHSETRDTVRAFVWGNSLVHHLTDSDETAVPYWLAEFADAADKELRLSGQWGFMWEWPKSLPPISNWSFKTVRQAWDSDRQRFSSAKFDTIMMNPVNFVQYQAADKPYEIDGQEDQSPLSAASAVLDWVADNTDKPRVFIYEGWADMASVARRFPPSNRDVRRYHRFNQGDYHDWHKDYMAGLRAAHPEMDLRLIPIAPVLSKLLRTAPFSDIEATALYSDDAPHGTATTYFLAAMMTYAAFYGESVPETYTPPADLHPIVVENFKDIRAFFAAEMGISDHASAAPAVSRAAQAVVKAEAAVPDPALEPAPELPGLAPAFGLQDPALAMGLNGIADWSTQHPFIDLMKTARPWIGHLPGQFGGRNADDLAAAGVLDPQGWVTAIPGDLRAVETLILTDQPKEATSIGGVYHVTYKGKGTIKIIGRARRVFLRGNAGRFHYQPGDGPVAIQITQTDPDGTGDYIRDLRIVHEDNLALAEVGAVFNPIWLAEVADLRGIRFMDWMFTNHSTQSTWEERPQIDDFTWGWRGVPMEVMVDLANLIGADPWFNMPHLATDTYMKNFATYVAENLDPERRAFVEYSNEVWNFTFGQATWALKTAEARWGKDVGSGAWMQVAGLRAAEMANIWTKAFGARAERDLIRVFGTHTDWPGLEQAAFFAPLALSEDPTLTPPVDSFDAYAVTGYFGYELGSDEVVKDLLDRLRKARAEVQATGEAQGLKRISLKQYVEARQHGPVVDHAIQLVRDGSLNRLISEVLPAQSTIAQAFGLDLIMYEGGTHIVATGEDVNIQELTDFFTHLNYTPQMAGLYEVLLQGWLEAGGTLFNAFVDVAPAGRFGSWGAKRYLEDENPRAVALANYNATAGGWWEDRAAGSFDHGRAIPGGRGNDRMEGSSRRDILLGQGGNDLLFANGRLDRLHGGPGRDVAVLPLARDAYVFSQSEGRVIAKAADHSVVMFDIEALRFGGETGAEVAMASVL